MVPAEAEDQTEGLTADLVCDTVAQHAWLWAAATRELTGSTSGHCKLFAYFWVRTPPALDHVVQACRHATSNMSAQKRLFPYCRRVVEESDSVLIPWLIKESDSGWDCGLESRNQTQVGTVALSQGIRLRLGLWPWVKESDSGWDCGFLEIS